MMNTNISQSLIWDDTPIDVTSEVNFIWSIANKLRGPYQSDKYKDVIIPMVIIRRFECALEKTKVKVVEQFKKNPNYPAKAMCRISGFQFYNTSEYTLEELLNDSEHLSANFKNYLSGFSANVQDIVRSLDFEKQIDKMAKHNRLFSVVKAFSELDLNPDTIDNMKMGYIFEDLIRKFSENAEAGDHYTGRDIIKLMVSLLFAEGCEDIKDEGKVITMIDQAAGTGGMLSTANYYIKRFNPTADVRFFSQEVNPESYAMCLAEMLIRGQNAENICLQDTMMKDRFPETKMRFVIENPPFGTAWSGKDAAEGVEAKVRQEFEKGSAGRFPAGLPSGGDMQLLFIQSAIDKMDDKQGRAAIVENGSPLFAGNSAGSGESQIRRWLLDNDYIEAIIQLSNDMFYNTGITTYIWILSKNKSEHRRGKVQLIDASAMSHKLRKALGEKKNEISPEDRAAITKLYTDFQPNEVCKIYKNDDFKYREYTVMQPLQRSYAVTEERIQAMLSKGALSALYDESKVYELENAEELSGKEEDKLEAYKRNQPTFEAIIDKLRNNCNDTIYLNPESFMPILTSLLEEFELDKKTIEKIADGLSVMDKSADIQKDKKGNVIYDKETKDTEIVPFLEDIDDYMEREVLPHIPDAKAFFEEDLGKKKPVIKTGAEIPFTRFFYKYKEPVKSDVLAAEIQEQEGKLADILSNLFSK
ncbi:type I restriction-modification system subunit M [Segatella bryantii]|uniref:type I restriction-modification system subunit M n=1 Tax=Segatella bryantii TaxID=77095 RepID=UPI00285358D0|nr:class I SAM-dependent DNA methyltransferase [Segatella bryantii]MDR4931859.1 class I SAM-dependent DNA methyltransferase [Segatella bryantii]